VKWWYIYPMTTLVQGFDKALKRARLTKRDDDGNLDPWTQYRLHLASGVSESTICEIEQGKVAAQDITKVKLSEALGAPELLDL
jgi:hypothetical protein